jgi:prohibitin 2
MNPIRLVGLVLVLVLGLTTVLGSFYVIDPGERGVVVTMGKVSPAFSSEGFGLKMPFFSSIVRVSIRQQTEGLKTETFSADLQQVSMSLKVLYRIPESSVVNIFQNYSGSPFDSLVAPRVQEALKEITALESAESIAKKRESVKSRALELARQKVGGTVVIEDLVIENIGLSDELEKAIESKMVQEQEAAKAKFTQQKAEIEAKTAVIRAEGEAKSIKIRGDAIRQNPGVIDLQIAEKWDGRSPLVVGSSKGGANILLPIGKDKE